MLAVVSIVFFDLFILVFVVVINISPQTQKHGDHDSDTVLISFVAYSLFYKDNSVCAFRRYIALEI